MEFGPQDSTLIPLPYRGRRRLKSQGASSRTSSQNVDGSVKGEPITQLCIVNPHQVGVSESLIRWGGGQICPPLVYGYRRVFSLFFLNWDLVLDEKGQNPKAQPSTFKIVGSRAKQKIGSRARKSLISKFCYLKMGDCRLSRAVRIKPRHVER